MMECSSKHNVTHYMHCRYTSCSKIWLHWRRTLWTICLAMRRIMQLPLFQCCVCLLWKKWDLQWIFNGDCSYHFRWTNSLLHFPVICIFKYIKQDWFSVIIWEMNNTAIVVWFDKLKYRNTKFHDTVDIFIKV